MFVYVFAQKIFLMYSWCTVHYSGISLSVRLMSRETKLSISSIWISIQSFKFCFYIRGDSVRLKILDI